MTEIAIASRLESAGYAIIQAEWLNLEKKFNINAVLPFIHPHITFLYSKRLVRLKDTDDLIHRFQAIADRLSPFVISITGFNHFGKEVIYLEINEQDKIRQLHQGISSSLSSYHDEIDPRYLPGYWIPHIAFVKDFPDHETFDKIWKTVRLEMLQFKQAIHNIGIYESNNGKEWYLLKEYSLTMPDATYRPKLSPGVNLGTGNLLSRL